MSQNVPECSTNRSLALRYLAAGLSQCATAKKLNISRKTVSRWMKDPKFQNELALQVKKYIQKADRIFLSILKKAPRTFRRIMDDKDHPGPALAAAKIVAGKFGLLTPVAPPKDPNIYEEVDLGGSLTVLTPAQFKLLPDEAGPAIIRLEDKPADAANLSGTGQDAK